MKGYPGLVIFSLALMLKGGFSTHEQPVSNCPYPLKVEVSYSPSEDPRCNIIASVVKSRLMFEVLDGFINEDQRVRAVREFERCKKSLCDNPAMVDHFMLPTTVTEMTNLLVAKVSANAFPGNLGFLRRLVAGRYQESISHSPFPVFEEEHMEGQQEAVFQILENVCGYQDESLITKIKPNDITEIFLSVLVDEYTRDHIDDSVVREMLNCSNSEQLGELWGRIANGVFSPISRLMRTCIDPAIAFPDYDRDVVTRVKTFALELGIECVSPTKVEAEEKTAAAEIDTGSVGSIFYPDDVAASPGGGGAPGESTNSGRSAPGESSDSRFDDGAPGAPSSPGGFTP